MAVDTETLFNQTAERKAEIDAERQNIAEQRQRLVQQESSVSPRNRAQLRQVRDQISGLDIQEKNLTHADRQNQSILDSQLRTQHQATQNAIKLSDKSMISQTIEETGNIVAGQMRLANQYGIGTPEYYNGMLELKDQNKLGWASQASKGHLGQIAALHDKISDENQKSLQKTLFDAHQLSPAQYAARDVAKDRLTNAPVLVDKNGKEDLKTGTPPAYDVVEAKRHKDGGTAAVDIGGRTYLFSKPLYDNLNSTFMPKKPTNTSSTDRPSEVNYNVPADRPPKGTNYTFSGAETPNHPGDYWSEPQANGLVTHHFASGGSATVADHATPEGQELINNARQQTANRKQFIEQNPSALTVAGGATASGSANGGEIPGTRVNFPANIPAAAPVEPTQAAAPAASQPNVLVQPYQMGDEKTGAKPSVQVNPSAATAPQVAVPQTPNTSNLPKVGDTREVGGVTHTWNGTRWDAP